ncbi:MAG: hypothetical protein H6926_07085 [Chromatiales bacterium]|nr:hypothetical protein [Chromatiales bacterium]
MLRSILMLLAALSVTHAAQAAVISGTQYTDGGKPVALQGLEWLSFDESLRIKRFDIENGIGNTLFADGWRYATRTETETLINSLWGGVWNGNSNDNFDGADWFLNTFGVGWGPATSADNINVTLSYFYFGELGDCGGGSNQSCIGRVARADHSTVDIVGIDALTGLPGTSYYANTGAWGQFSDTYGGDFGLYATNQTVDYSAGFTQGGSLLVRGGVASVPAPGLLATLAIGGVALLAMTRRRSLRSAANSWCGSGFGRLRSALLTT